jgi:excisionase family DNA binding protein
MQRLTYSPKEACFLLNISRAHFYRLVRAGSLSTYKEGRGTRIAADVLRHYVQTRARIARGLEP